MRRLILLLLVSAALLGCGSSRKAWSPDKKFAPAVLQKDYHIYRTTLEEVHPGLYWYTTKDSLDHYFDWGAAQLKDSLTEPQFRKIIAYVTSKIDCGHTSVRYSKNYLNYLDTMRIARIFPLSLKLWQGNAVVATNLNRRDSLLRRGTVIKAIDGRPMETIVDSLFNFLSTDGYNTTHKYQTLSNRGYFGSLYSSVYGFSRRYTIDYLDSTGVPRQTIITPFYPGADTSNRAAMMPMVREPKPSRRERRTMRKNSVRLLKLDTTGHVAMMDLNSFSKGYGLRGFYRRSFRALKQHHIEHLVIDVRTNGGGSVTNSTLMTRYLADHRFKVGDSLYAVTRKKTYGKYIKHDRWNKVFMTFFARKLRKDGLYHFRYFERHYFSPKKQNHYKGKTYILTGGNSFSATTLFVGAVRDQDNVLVIGEETGGGAYGNNAWLIPDVTLPGTGLGFRLPLFRLVIDRAKPKTGKGVQPEVFSGPTVEDVRNGVDYKLEKALELIRKDLGEK